MGNDCKLPTELNRMKGTIVKSMHEVAVDKMLPTGFPQVLTRLGQQIINTPQEYLEIQSQKALTEWQKTGYKDSRNTNSNMDNIYVLQNVKDVIMTRHIAFQNTPSFQTDCANNASRTFATFESEQKSDLDRLKNYLSSFLASYKSLYEYNRSVSAIINSKRANLSKFKNKIDTYNQNYHIDGRKDSYQNKNFNFYKSIYYYLLIVYYSLFVLYLIFSEFIKEKQYRNKNLLGFMVLYLILPYTLQYIYGIIYNFYIYVLEYYNLREEVISYPYIIEDREKYS